MSTSQKVNWPDLTLPPINLWNAPKMNNQFAITVTFFVNKNEEDCADEEHAYEIARQFLIDVTPETLLEDYTIACVEEINV